MIIQSLLDTDLYKFTMMQAVLHQFPGAQVEYRFYLIRHKDRSLSRAVKAFVELARSFQLRSQALRSGTAPRASARAACR